ncbi:MAG: transcriptional repressor [Deltaproteobacteria bacterium]|nr:transcriptional repressor [Deltaproteobacteria bacterium]MDQ3296059.1 transcriptional repressor [Myxococcota bacterium]
MAKNLDELRAVVRANGLRATPSRLAVLELVRASDAPVSHGDVADRLASQGWDRATIYRNLTDLAEVGLLRRTDVGDHVWRFEAVNAEHDAAHPHFVCTECGTVECMPQIELAIHRVKAPRAVKQRQVEVHVRGLCDACI